MKIAAVVDKDNKLRPLDQGETIVIFEGNENKKLLMNPGFGFKHGGKEKAMKLILENGADAVLANKQFLCPCSYEMSFGRLKYILAESETLDQLMQDYAKSAVKIFSELDPELYAEEHHHHKRHSSVNADLV
jgi:hypothetical protein